jgi:hypothetical protein
MSVMTQPTPQEAYTIATGATSTSPFIEIFAPRNPGPTDNNYPIQKRWWNTVANSEWILVGFTSDINGLHAIWEQISSSGSPVETITGDDSVVIFPIANNINLVGDGIITTSGVAISATETISLTGIVPAAHGGTGAANPPAHTLPVAEGALPFTFLGPLTSGQLLIGSTGTDPVPATLTPGSGISITNGPGSIMLSVLGAGFNWQAISVNTALVKENGYVCVSPGGTLTLTLPAVSAIGDTIKIILQGATGFIIAQPNAGTQIFVGKVSSTVGVGGSVSSSQQGDTVEIICTSTNASWNVMSSMGNLIIV